MQLQGIELSVSSDLTKEMGLLKAKVESIKAKHDNMKGDIVKAIVHYKAAKMLCAKVSKMKEKFGIEPKELNTMMMEMEAKGEYLNNLNKL
jgi:sporulation-control protein spo0M